MRVSLCPKFLATTSNGAPFITARLPLPFVLSNVPPALVHSCSESEQ